MIKCEDHNLFYFISFFIGCAVYYIKSVIASNMVSYQESMLDQDQTMLQMK